jgi:hypothetical protein
MAKTLVLEDGELQALLQLMDLGVKAGGLSVARAAAHLVNLIEAAPDANSVTQTAPLHGDGTRPEGTGEAAS